jgi:hypothetical protein
MTIAIRDPRSVVSVFDSWAAASGIGPASKIPQKRMRIDGKVRGRVVEGIVDVITIHVE